MPPGFLKNRETQTICHVHVQSVHSSIRLRRQLHIPPPSGKKFLRLPNTSQAMEILR